MATGNFVPPVKTMKQYHVRNIQENEIIITGKGDSPLWENAIPLTDFAYPWENEITHSVTFSALHNKDWLYCLFTVRDKDVKIFRVNDDKSEVIKSDRVEIFFRQDDRLSPYYCLELDPLARIYDYEAQYHRIFKTDWSWPAGQLIVKTHQTEDGYSVEIAVHKNSLRNLGLLKDDLIEAGLYRAECISINDTGAEMKWISWMMPDSPTPDFHIPSSFGVLLLEH